MSTSVTPNPVDPLVSSVLRVRPQGTRRTRDRGLGVEGEWTYDMTTNDTNITHCHFVSLRDHES